jgi:hypothetical protein
MTIGVPFQKGKSGNPAGRPKDTHRIRFDVAEICKKNGCNPFEILAQIAAATIDIPPEQKKYLTARIRMEAAAELAQYLAPKLKAVELSADADNPVQVTINLGHADQL